MNTLIRMFTRTVWLVLITYQLGCSLAVTDTLSVTLAEHTENDFHPAIRLRAENNTNAAVTNLVCDVMAYRDETIVDVAFMLFINGGTLYPGQAAEALGTFYSLNTTSQYNRVDWKCSYADIARTGL